jgi:hypothetical protein
VTPLYENNTDRSSLWLWQLCMYSSFTCLYDTCPRQEKLWQAKEVTCPCDTSVYTVKYVFIWATFNCLSDIFIPHMRDSYDKLDIYTLYIFVCDLSMRLVRVTCPCDLSVWLVRMTCPCYLSVWHICMKQQYCHHCRCHSQVCTGTVYVWLTCLLYDACVQDKRKIVMSG